MQTDKIAVIELSTKAVKWLIPIVDNETIESTPFNFKHFYKESQKTETGNGLNSQGILSERYFVSRVLPYIKKAYSTVMKANVDVVYCVATAVYRSARNINSILQIIKQETGLEVCILTEEEEAEYTFWAYFYSTTHQEELVQKPYTLLIDQGGGSTEITFFHKQKMVFRKSFDMGTTILKNDFFSQTQELTIDRFTYIDNNYQQIIRNDLEGLGIENAHMSNEDIYCVCVGTAVTAAFGDGSRPNKAIHERSLDLNQIETIIDERNKEFCAMSPLAIQEQVENAGGKPNTMEKRFSSRLGLPVISEILQFFNIQSVRISGTGLWYGVFYANFYDLQIQ